MNPVSSFTETVSARSTKSSTAANDPNGALPVSEAGADGERSREFAEFLEQVPGQPTTSGAVAEPVAPVVAKPIDGWSAKSLASLMSFLDQPPPADPALDQAVDELPDDAADAPADETALALATTAVEPLAMPVAPPPQPIQSDMKAATTETAAPVAELPPNGTAAPIGSAHDAARALATTAAPAQPAAQSAAHAAAQSNNQATQARRGPAADNGGERASDATVSDGTTAVGEGAESGTSSPLDRATVAAQRERSDKDSRSQPTLAGDNDLAPKSDPAPRTDASSSLGSSSSGVETGDQEDVLKSANVKSVSQETHFMLPSHRAEPARQIGAAVVAEVAQTATAQPADEPASSEPVVKVLNLHLEPRELGAVHVRMHLSHGAMTLSVKVETEELASRLQRDSDILTKMLQSSGVTLDGLVVQSLGVERSASSGNDPSMNQKNQDTQSNQANSNSSGTNDGRARGDEGGQGGRSQRDGLERYEPAPPASAPGRGGPRAAGAIYI